MEEELNDDEVDDEVEDVRGCVIVIGASGRSTWVFRVETVRLVRQERMGRKRVLYGHRG